MAVKQHDDLSLPKYMIDSATRVRSNAFTNNSFGRKVATVTLESVPPAKSLSKKRARAAISTPIVQVPCVTPDPVVSKVMAGSVGGRIAGGKGVADSVMVEEIEEEEIEEEELELDPIEVDVQVRLSPPVKKKRQRTAALSKPTGVRGKKPATGTSLLKKKKVQTLLVK